jgi:hypothetical protein
MMELLFKEKSNHNTTTVNHASETLPYKIYKLKKKTTRGVIAQI